MGWLRKPAESLGVTGGGVHQPSPGGSAAEVPWDGQDLETGSRCRKLVYWETFGARRADLRPALSLGVVIVL